MNKLFKLIKLRTKETLIACLIIVNISLILALTASGQTKHNQDLININNLSSFEDVSSYLSKTAHRKGAKYAYDILRQAVFSQNIDVHLLGHVVGDVLYKQEGAKGITTCTQDFRNACSHSIVVGLLLDKGVGAMEVIGKICQLAPGGSGAYTMCFHGLGHGVLAYAEYNLEKSVEICQMIKSERHYQDEIKECIGGSIMEIIGGGFHDKRKWEEQSKKYLTASNPLSPCNASFMPKNAQVQCYTYLTPHLFIMAGGNLANPTEDTFKKAFEFCKKIDDADEQNKGACFGGFGKEFIVIAKNRDVRKMNEATDEELRKTYKWCKLSNEKQATIHCLNSAVSSLFWGGENGKEIPTKFCSIIKEEDLKQGCFETLIHSVEFYIQDASYRKSFCKEIPQNYEKLCISALKI